MAETAESPARLERVRGWGREGILVLDSESGSILDVDPFLAGLLGRPRDVLIGRSLEESDVFEDRANLEATLELIRRDGYAICGDVRVKTRDRGCVLMELVGNSYVADRRKVIQLHLCEVPGHG